MMLCHPVMAVRHVIETQKKKRNARVERKRDDAPLGLGRDFDLSPLKSTKTLITLSETTRVATLDPEL